MIVNGGKNFDIGEVVSVTDTKYLGRIKLELKGLGLLVVMMVLC
jgi:hypothetical protein